MTRSDLDEAFAVPASVPMIRYGSGGVPSSRPAADARPVPRFAVHPSGTAVTVRELVLPSHVRFAMAVAEASLVRDVAAFGAVVVFATMVALICGIGAGA